MIRRLLLLLSIGSLLTVFLWSGYEIGTRHQEYQVARSEYAALREQFGVPSRMPDKVSAGVPNTAQDNEYEQTNPESVNFDALQVINPSAMGWITVPGTDVSYPIAQAHDNDWYLWRTFSGERNASGAIFLDFRNAPDFTDPHSILHGHNMRDGSMFAPLHSWTGDRFFIHTPDGVLEFEVFNRQAVPADDELYALHYTDNEVQVVTLSTCVTGRPHLRYVVQGQLRDNLSRG